MITSLPALLPFVMTLANVAAWRCLTPGRTPTGRRSVLIPARNDSANIDACLAAAVANEAHEILVCDDASTDDTAPRVLACRDPGVRLAPDAFARLGSVSTVDLLSVVPRQEVVSFGERLVLPLLHLTYTSWLFLPAIRWSSGPAVVAANRQVLLARADSLATIGGFGVIRGEVVDDMALMRAVRAGGGTIDFRDGDGVATCRMYRSAAEVADGFSKNLYPGIGGHPLALLGVLALYFTTLLLPWVAVAWTPCAWIGIATNLLQRALLAARFRHPLGDILLHPLSILAFFAIALRSGWWSHTGWGRWRGRTVAAGSSLPSPEARRKPATIRTPAPPAARRSRWGSWEHHR